MLEDWFKEIPVVTRTYFTLALVTTTACGMDLISPFHLYLNFNLITTRREYWRLLTTFCYFGKFGLDFMFHMFFLVRYCRMLEESAHFRGRPADFLWMMLFGAVSMLLLSTFVSVHFLGSSLTFMMVYVWGRRHHHVRMSFLGLFPFTAAYLPLVLLGFSLLLHSSITLDVLGIAVGHTYYFFMDVYPHLGGKPLLRAPAFLHQAFGTPLEGEQHVVPDVGEHPDLVQPGDDHHGDHGDDDGVQAHVHED